MRSRLGFGRGDGRSHAGSGLSARSVIAAILKRLAHRNPNVQLYSLALADSLSKNCTVELHREIASRAFTQALEKLITDRVRVHSPSLVLELLSS